MTKSIKVDKAKAIATELNKEFHGKSIISNEFYQQLEDNDFTVSQCILIGFFPDSGDTYCGKIIKQDGRIFEFDVSLGSPDYSIWDDITVEFCDWYKRNYKSKPWEEEIVAYEMFKSMGKNN